MKTAVLGDILGLLIQLLTKLFKLCPTRISRRRENLHNLIGCCFKVNIQTLQILL